METKKARNYSRYTKEAVILLGNQVQLGRKERGLTEKDLAERAGISRKLMANGVPFAGQCRIF